MRKHLSAIFILLVMSTLALGQLGGMPAPKSTRKPITSRTLQGVVMDKADAPLPDSIVYLKNTKTMALKTFIADKDGNYRFAGLSPSQDYEVYAEYKGTKSDSKTLSSFDSREKAYINLRVDTAKK